MTDFKTPLDSQVKKLISKPAVTVLGCSLSAISLVLLTRAIISAVSSQRLDIYASLYYLFGSSSIFIVNIIMGIILAAAALFMAVGIFTARSGVTNFSPMSSSTFTVMKASAIFAVIITAVTIIISFASVSVLNYNYVSNTANLKPTDSMYFYYNSNADSLFWATILLGAAAVMSECALIRLSSSLQRNIKKAEPVKNGAVLLSISSIIGTVISSVIFCITLYSLVVPSRSYRERIYNDLPAAGLEPSTLALNTLNIVIYAAAAVVFISAVISAFSYAVSIDLINKRIRQSAYNNIHTAVNPQNYPDYTVPGNYNYNQPPEFVPYYDLNRSHQSTYKNIYTGEVPPAPETPVNPFLPQQPTIPRTQYPDQQASTNSPKTENAAQTSGDNQA